MLPHDIVLGDGCHVDDVQASATNTRQPSSSPSPSKLMGRMISGVFSDLMKVEALEVLLPRLLRVHAAAAAAAATTEW